jgi:hypothetical protein
MDRPLVRREHGFAARARGKPELTPPARGAPKNPLPLPLRQLDDGLEGFVAGLFHQPQIRLAKADGQERRTAFFWQAGEPGIKNIEMRAGKGARIRKRGQDSRRGVAHGRIVAASPMRLQNLDRDKNLAPRAMPRQSPDQPGSPIGNPRMEGGIAARGSLRSVEDERGKPQKIRTRRLYIGFEGVDGLDRIAIKVALPRGNQFEERRFWQIEARDRIAQRCGDRVGVRIGRPVERVPPPLQPDFAKQGLGDDFAHAGDFETESIEGVDMQPRLARNKKAREPAVSIVAAEQSLAVGVIRINWLRLPPAPTPASSRGSWSAAPDPRNRRAGRGRSASANK